MANLRKKFEKDNAKKLYVYIGEVKIKIDIVAIDKMYVKWLENIINKKVVKEYQLEMI